MVQLKKSQRNPKIWVAALIATSIATISYKLYNSYFNEASGEKGKKIKKYTSKSIALTLSHSVLSSQLPLNEILVNCENVTFILPPNLSMDDLTHNISDNYKLPETLIQNYKLLNCSNLQGYFNILKNLRPDMLLICADDLGLTGFPNDLNRFIKEIVTIDQNVDDVHLKISPLFIN